MFKYTATINHILTLRPSPLCVYTAPQREPPCCCQTGDSHTTWRRAVRLVFDWRSCTLCKISSHLHLPHYCHLTKGGLQLLHPIVTDVVVIHVEAEQLLAVLQYKVQGGAVA